jgi:hypothetical protein
MTVKSARERTNAGYAGPESVIGSGLSLRGLKAPMATVGNLGRLKEHLRQHGSTVGLRDALIDGRSATVSQKVAK